MSNRNFNKKKFVLADCSQMEKNFQPVQPNLALTPKDVRELTNRGLSVSTQALGVITDPDTPPGYLPLEHRRGVDLNTTWEVSQSAKKEIIRNYNVSKRLKDK